MSGQWPCRPQESPSIVTIPQTAGTPGFTDAQAREVGDGTVIGLGVG